MNIRLSIGVLISALGLLSVAPAFAQSGSGGEADQLDRDFYNEYLDSVPDEWAPDPLLLQANLFASESCWEVCQEALRIHGGNGYANEYDIERLYRDAPLMIVGEGTSEIQKMVIGRRLLEDYAIET